MAAEEVAFAEEVAVENVDEAATITEATATAETEVADETTEEEVAIVEAGLGCDEQAPIAREFHMGTQGHRRTLPHF